MRKSAVGSDGDSKGRFRRRSVAQETNAGYPGSPAVPDQVGRRSDDRAQVAQNRGYAAPGLILASEWIRPDSGDRDHTAIGAVFASLSDRGWVRSAVSPSPFHLPALTAERRPPWTGVIAPGAASQATGRRGHPGPGNIARLPDVLLNVSQLTPHGDGGLRAAPRSSGSCGRGLKS